MPTEVPMQRDIELWKSNCLSADERLVILRNLGFFSTAESLVGNNIVLAIFKHITNPECRQYLLRQAFEEAIHTHAFHYICQSLALDEREVFNMYHEVNSIHDKDAFEMRLTEDILRSGFNTDTAAGIQQFLRNLVGFYVIMEGIFFYSGFVMMLSFHRQNRMTGIGEQFQYILRDETIGRANQRNSARRRGKPAAERDLGQAGRAKFKSLQVPAFAVGLEIAYARDCLPRGLLGLSADLFREYVQYIADRRLERLGLKARYGSGNPFPWMSETMDLRKEKNFFETRVTEYQNGGALTW